MKAINKIGAALLSMLLAISLISGLAPVYGVATEGFRDYSLSGTVTINGEPVERVSITFTANRSKYHYDGYDDTNDMAAGYGSDYYNTIYTNEDGEYLIEEPLRNVDFEFQVRMEYEDYVINRKLYVPVSGPIYYQECNFNEATGEYEPVGENIEVSNTAFNFEINTDQEVAVAEPVLPDIPDVQDTPDVPDIPGQEVTDKISTKLILGVMIPCIVILAALVWLMYQKKYSVEIYNNQNKDEYGGKDWKPVYGEKLHNEDDKTFSVTLPKKVLREKATDQFQIRLNKRFCQKYNGDMLVIKLEDSKTYTFEIDKEENIVEFTATSFK